MYELKKTNNQDSEIKKKIIRISQKIRELKIEASSMGYQQRFASLPDINSKQWSPDVIFKNLSLIAVIRNSIIGCKLLTWLFFHYCQDMIFALKFHVKSLFLTWYLIHMITFWTWICCLPWLIRLSCHFVAGGPLCLLLWSCHGCGFCRTYLGKCDWLQGSSRDFHGGLVIVRYWRWWLYGTRLTLFYELLFMIDPFFCAQDCL